MASYGFITSSAQKNSDGSRKAFDPYAATQPKTGQFDLPSSYQKTPGGSNSGMANSAYTMSSGDPYAGTQGTSEQEIPLDFASANPYANTGSYRPTGPNDPYAGTPGGSNSDMANSAYTMGGYQPQNYTAANGSQVQWGEPTGGQSIQGLTRGAGGSSPGLGSPAYTMSAAPTFQPVGNVGMPTGYDNNVAAYNDPSYREAMAAWAQTGLPAQQAINNQQNADREFAFNAWLQQNQMGQTQWRDSEANRLAWGGLGLQQQLAQDAANQWGAQFGYQQQRDVRGDWVNDRDYQASIVQANRDYEQSGQRIDIDRARQQADAAYQSGTLDINRYKAEMDRLKQVEDNALSTIIADRNYEQSGQKIEIDRAKQQADAAYQQGTLDINRYKAEMDRLGQLENNARMIAKDRADAAYQQGTLQQQRYSTDTGAQISREQLGQQRYSTDINAQISREQMQRAYDTAVMQAVGRNQAQNVRWMRG